MSNKFKVGDKVLYEGQPCVIEQELGNDVYFVGAEDWWVDCVPAAEMEKA